MGQTITLELPFAAGERVYPIFTMGTSRMEPCPFCGVDEGQICGCDGSWELCPRCRGKKQVEGDLVETWTSETAEVKVSHYRLAVDGGKPELRLVLVDWNDEPWSFDDDPSIPLTDVFTSQELAEAACVERNQSS